jgi:bifunctional non-homologous end joining protein LigD
MPKTKVVTPAGVKKAAKATGAADAVDEQLARYRSMRHFEVTEEPSGGSAKARQEWRELGLPFVIQKHAASHLHYDFRLGWNGVLKSWAVTKGPSYVVADKRLAVQVEDHPMEYGGFEGIIPAGQYGGGTVMVWDQGTWEPQPGHTDVEAGLRDGSLKFVLHGSKLQGKWALIRMGGKAGGSEKKPNWLLIKEHDAFERPAGAETVTEAEPNSAVTGRSIEQIAGSEDHVWNSKQTAGTGQAWYRQSSKKEERVGAPGALNLAHPDLAQRLKQLPQEKQPAFVKPQLALEAETPPEGAGWLHELKLDGYRMQARKDGAKVQMLTRTGLDWTARMRAIAEEVGRLPMDTVTLDGEVVVLAEDGTTSFAALQAALQEGERHLLTYFCFDLLHLEGRSTRELPLIERKRLLTEVLAGADPAVLAVSEHLETGGGRMFHEVCALGAEGIVSKRADAAYLPGSRGGGWLKLKCLHEQEFVVGGYTLPGKGSAGSQAVGALLLGYYRDGNLIYAGRTGTGFTEKMHRMLRAQLETMKLPAPQRTGAFAAVPPEARRGAIWVRPELVAQVRFSTWTADNLVRQAAFLGLREDKPATEVVREVAAPTPKRRARETHISANEAVAKMGHTDTERAKRSSASASHGVRGRAVAAKLAADAAAGEHAAVRLTHPDKVLDAESRLTKQMLADYYWGIAERMLPHIAGRPLSLVRCPEGTGKPCFFQKHVTTTLAALPKGIEAVQVPDKKTGKPEPYITLHTREALAGLAQMGVLEVHPWGARNEDLEHPDRIVIDLDPDEALRWARLAEAAAEVRTQLKKLGLESFLKTTGGKGLHVVLPIEPALDWAAGKEFAHRLVLAMEKANPALYLTKMTKSARAGKIYLDYLRNERGATAVAPYSPRSRAGAPVSMPLAWSDLKLAERPVFRVAEFAEWRGRLKTDPWKALPGLAQTISAEALAALGIRR